MIQYKAQFYPNRDTNIKHSIDLDFLKQLYGKYVSMNPNKFRKNLKHDKFFRNDLQHFIHVIIWVSDSLTLHQIKFLNSDYGALHLLTHMRFDKECRKNYAESVQIQIRDFCKVPETWINKELIVQ